MIFLSNSQVFTFTKIADHFLSLHQVTKCPTRSADESRFLLIGETTVESSAYLKRTGQSLKEISKSFENI